MSKRDSVEVSQGSPSKKADFGFNVARSTTNFDQSPDREGNINRFLYFYGPEIVKR